MKVRELVSESGSVSLVKLAICFGIGLSDQRFLGPLLDSADTERVKIDRFGKQFWRVEQITSLENTRFLGWPAV